MPSVAHSTNQRTNAGHEPSVPSIITKRNGAASRRPTVTPLAGVASADGPKLVAMVRPLGSATRSGPIAPEIVTVANAPTASDCGTSMIPSISGASRWLRATPGASTSTSTVEPISASRRARGDVVLQLDRSSPRRSATSSESTCPSRPAAYVPSSRENAKKPHQSSWARLDEREQLVVIALGLARVADDEVRAERGVGTTGPDVVDPPQEPLAVAPPAHPPEQRLATRAAARGRSRARPAAQITSIRPSERSEGYR